MSVMTIRLPDGQYARLKSLAARRGISVNKLIEDLATRALTEHDVEARFRVRAARGDDAAGLAVLNAFDTEGPD